MFKNGRKWSEVGTLFIVYKKHPIRNTSQNFEKYKNQGLVFFKNLRNIFFIIFLRNTSMQCDHKKQKNIFSMMKDILCFVVAKS